MLGHIHINFTREIINKVEEQILKLCFIYVSNFIIRKNNELLFHSNYHHFLSYIQEYSQRKCLFSNFCFQQRFYCSNSTGFKWLFPLHKNNTIVKWIEFGQIFKCVGQLYKCLIYLKIYMPDITK